MELSLATHLMGGRARTETQLQIAHLGHVSDQMNGKMIHVSSRQLIRISDRPVILAAGEPMGDTCLKMTSSFPWIYMFEITASA